MARYLGPKVKLSRQVGVPIADIPKHTAKRQLTQPGMHGYRGRRIKDYGVRLTEKQKLRYHYNVMEKQFRRYVTEASRRKGNTGEVLLTLLERRLDNVVRKLGFAGSPKAARQIVTHGHIMVNGRKIDRPSYELKVNDRVTARDSDTARQLIKNNLETCGPTTQAWLQLDPSKLEATMVALPTRDAIEIEVNEQLIVEMCSR